MDAHGDGARGMFFKSDIFCMRRTPRGAHRIFFKNMFLRFEIVCFMAKFECQAGPFFVLQKMRRAPRGAQRIFLKKQFLIFQTNATREAQNFQRRGAS